MTTAAALRIPEGKMLPEYDDEGGDRRPCMGSIRKRTGQSKSPRVANPRRQKHSRSGSLSFIGAGQTQYFQSVPSSSSRRKLLLRMQMRYVLDQTDQ